MKRTFLRATVVSALTLAASHAHAVAIGFTEGLRPTVAGTTTIESITGGVDAVAVAPGFNLGSLTSIDDTIDIFGRIKGQSDFYSISATKPMKVEFIADGFHFDADGVAKTATFTLRRGMDIVFSTDFTSELEPVVIGTNIAPGDFTLEIDGSVDRIDALYDIRFSVVPLPASLPLMAVALAGVAFISRRKV